jgi:2-furoyl-CoA dehydrogenase large subunit
VTLAAEGDGTRVTYNYTVEIGGKVAAVGGRMIEGAARVVVGQFFSRLAAQVSPAAPGAPGTARGGWWNRLLAALGLR